jgi:hypothetical protein
MIGFIKKHRLGLAVTGLVILLGINVYLFVNSSALSGELDRLEQENKKSGEIQIALEKQIKEKQNQIRTLDKKLTRSLSGYRALKTQLDNLPAQKPANPDTFKKLEDCQTMYRLLAADFNLCLETGKKSQITLDLCMDKTIGQQAVIDLQEKAYDECREQGRLKDQKILNTEKALKNLDRYYKRRLFKRGLLKYVIGIAAGMVAGYFIFGGQ